MAAVCGSCSLMGRGRKPLPGVDAFGCLRSLRARSALDGRPDLEFELPPVVRQHEVGGLIQERSHAPVAAFRDAADVPITHTFGNQLTDARARLVIGPSWQSMSSPVLSFAMRMMRSRGSSIVLIFSPEAQGLRSHRAMDVIGAAAVRMNERGRRLSRRDSPAALAAPASAACWSWLARYRCCRRLWRAPRVLSTKSPWRRQFRCRRR